MSYPVFQLVRREDPVSVILKLVGESCNLDCSYCYEKRKPYSGSRILRALSIKRFLERLPQGAVALELHGGEPLLYPTEEFEELSIVLQRHLGRIVRLTMQTNGVLLDRDRIRFLRGLFPSLQIGISLDGPGEFNDLRVNLQGGASTAAVVEALKSCAAEGVDVGIICVVHRGSLGSAGPILRFFAEYPAVKVVKLVPCFDTQVLQESGPVRRRAVRIAIGDSCGKTLPWGITPSQYTMFIEEATNFWIANIGPRRYVLEPVTSALRSLGGLATNNCHFAGRKCSHVYTLYPDDTFGACDELDRRQVEYGPIDSTSPLAAAHALWAEPAEQGMRELLQMCLNCEFARVCGGGCLATRRRLLAAGDSTSYCAHRKSLLATLAVLTEGASHAT
ncbi:MAG: radical SAM protein [Acidovorax sp.]|uniref:radical SAM protein n=1 Tax=Acidovorax sp. TaxID=1872122 RepID=UPI00391C35A5